MHIDGILEHNRDFVLKRPARPLPPADKIDLAVVACYDPRLDELLRQALGLAPGQAFVIRTGGALVQPGGAALRTLALATFMFGVTEVLVVGHTSCRMASFDTAAFIDAFRKRNVSRESFGDEDLRSWAGAIADPRSGVQQSVTNLLTAPMLPKDLQVAGLVLDDTTGALEVVVRPGEVPALGATAPVTPSPPEPAIQTPAPPAGGTAAGAVSPQPAKPHGPAGSARDPMAVALEDFIQTLESKAGLGQELRQLRLELDRQQNPVVKLRLLESFIRRAAVDSREVADAYRRLQNDVTAARRHWDPREVLRHFLQLTRRP